MEKCSISTHPRLGSAGEVGGGGTSWRRGLWGGDTSWTREVPIQEIFNWLNIILGPGPPTGTPAWAACERGRGAVREQMSGTRPKAARVYPVDGQDATGLAL
jgi:hypothetical protein